MFFRTRSHVTNGRPSSERRPASSRLSSPKPLTGLTLSNLPSHPTLRSPFAVFADRPSSSLLAQFAAALFSSGPLPGAQYHCPRLRSRLCRWLSPIDFLGVEALLPVHRTCAACHPTRWFPPLVLAIWTRCWPLSPPSQSRDRAADRRPRQQANDFYTPHIFTNPVKTFFANFVWIIKF